MLKGDNNIVSMAFLYSPPIFTNSTKQQENNDFAISITQQFILCVLVTLTYTFLIYVYHIFV